MKRIVLITLVGLTMAIGLKAQTIQLFHEKKDQGFTIYATNKEYYPISVLVDLTLSNLLFSAGEKKVFVVPAKSEKFTIGELTIAEKGIAANFNYRYKSTIGDVTISNYDQAFLYDLPFQKGKTYHVVQGYNGIFSHQNENAIDFVMPEGSEILAAREGIVVKIEKNNTESCPREECKKYNNYIMIMHADGTFASYVHIKANGTNRNVGDSVKKGDVIAYSGNVGWSSRPHLHFVCFLGGFGKWNTLETTFRIAKGDHAEQLKEGNSYLRNY